MGTDIARPKGKLRLSWLGTPLVSHADDRLSFRTRKALALLIYLTVEPGIHTREKLVALFWPESDTTRGRGMLRTTLAYLREALEPLGRSYLNVEPQTLSFDFNSDFELDLLLLQAGLETIQRQPGPTARQEEIRQLQKIVASKRGDFLEGFSLADAPDFDDWVTVQREIWHSRIGLVFDTLSQWQFEAGDLPAALETATRWKAHDPYAENAPQRLMQLHFADGNRAAALEVYDAYGKMLAAEFGGNPSSEINALAARIRSISPVRMPPQEARPTRAAADLTFVGRVEEFAHLKRAYEAATHGQTQAVVLVGEAGIGKTRLTTEFLHWATAQGADVLPGRSFETGGEVPYQPIAQLLRHRLEQGESFADLLSPTWLAELSRLLPEVRDLFPGLPQPQPDEATAQSRLLESITRLGEALSRRAPLLLFLDDIQWADSSSLDALHYAVSRWTEHQAPILLLICTRDSSATANSHLRHWLTSLSANLAVTQLELAPLTVEDTMALLASLERDQARSRHAAQGVEGQAGGEQGISATSSAAPSLRGFAQALFEETGGQPLYLVETIKTLLEQKVLIPYQSEEGSRGLQWRTLTGETTGQFPLPRIIPNSVRAAILDRLSRLTPAAVAMLTAAAVLGQAATFRQLVEVASIEQMAGLDALEELVGKRLLLDVESRGQTYVIAHDKIRDVIYAESSVARRQVLHSRAVAAIQGGDPARMAYHALAAGLDAEAFEYSMVAGAAAMHLFAASEAIAHYETARKLLAAGSVPPVDLAKVQHLYLNLGRALELTFRFEQAEAVLEELKTIAAQRAAPALKLEALVAQAYLWSRVSQVRDPARGEALAQEALRLARELGDQVAETKILSVLIDYYRLSNRLPEALRCGDQALALARSLNVREQLAQILNAIMKYHLFSGHIDLAEQAQCEAVEVWRELNNLPMLADSLANLAFLARWAGNYDRALSLSAEAFHVSQSIADVWGESYSQIVKGYIFWERGDVAQAIAVMEECIRLAERAVYLTPQILTRSDLGVIYATLGDSQHGFETLQLALELANTSLPIYRAYVIGVLARQYLHNNCLREAETLVEQGKNEVNAHPFTFVSQWVYLAEAELSLKQANVARALALADELLNLILQVGLRSSLPVVLHLRGQCFVAMGEQAAARAVLLEARAAAEALGSRRMLLQILPLLASVESDSRQAEQLSQQAEECKAYIVDHLPPELHHLSELASSANI